MATCINQRLSPSYSYRKGCRCDRCSAWKKDAASRTNDPEKAKKRSREWRKNNRERSRKASIDYQKKNPHKVLEWQLKKYGLTLQQYRDMETKQCGLCAICGKPPSGMQRVKSRLCVDHDKYTGKVRGLLCGSCNVGIGHFLHSDDLLVRAVLYIGRTS